MKNFSEAQVIKPNFKLDISILLVGVDSCNCILTVNKKILSESILNGSVEFKTRVELNEAIDIKISIQNRQHPQAVIISGIYIDGYEIMPKYQHLSTPPTNYLDSNGTWTFRIPSFYPWYHSITGQGWIA